MSEINFGQGKDLNNLAREVLQKYGISPQQISIIQSGSIKTVWKVKTMDKVLCLKRLKQTLDKALFSVNAQIYIKNNGGNVPGIIPNSNNQPITEHSSQLFVVYEWLEGRDLNFSNPGDFKLALEGLAKFHISSKGYESSDTSRTSTKLGKWPEQYASMRNKFIAWKEASSNNLSAAHYNSFYRASDSMISLANMALDYISKSSYENLTSKDSDAIVLCHQDYGKGNAILSGKGVSVLDLDGVTFDLPARDLRKLIGKEAENRGRWQLENIENVFRIYSSVNPLSSEERKVLFIDLLYPHWFYGLVKNLFQNNKALKSSEIERMARLEESKVPLIKSMI